MNFHWNIETYLLVSTIALSLLGSVLIMKINWKQYGLLYVTAAITGNIICYIFVSLGLYSFPYRLFPRLARFPLFTILTLFPFYVMAGVRYSPKKWVYKIPFYWAVVHIGVLVEVLAEKYTQIIKYGRSWDTWDSYTWWWLFLLTMEYVGGLFVSNEFRKPVDEELFRYGKKGWFIFHFIVIVTIFLAGIDMGVMISK